MLETLEEAAPEVVLAGIELAGKLLAGGHIGLQDLLRVPRCASITFGASSLASRLLAGGHIGPQDLLRVPRSALSLCFA